MFQKHHQQYTNNNRSLLSPNIKATLDELIDRINRNQGPRTQNNTNSSRTIRAILIGTTDGVALSRCYGSDDQPSISEEILSSIETVYAALPSDMEDNQHQSHNSNAASHTYSGGNNGNKTNNQPGAGHHLHPLQLGRVKTIMAFYNNGITVMHVHQPPMVLTILCNEFGNIGAVKAILPGLLELLDPIRVALKGKLGLPADTAIGGGMGSNGQQGGQHLSHSQLMTMQQAMMQQSQQQQQQFLNSNAIQLQMQQQQQMQMSGMPSDMMMNNQQQQQQQQQQQHLNPYGYQ